MGSLRFRWQRSTVFPLGRALDTVTQRWFGKNLLVLARK
jgi:hypothetical protein